MQLLGQTWLYTIATHQTPYYSSHDSGPIGGKGKQSAVSLLQGGVFFVVVCFVLFFPKKKPLVRKVKPTMPSLVTLQSVPYQIHFNLSVFHMYSTSSQCLNTHTLMEILKQFLQSCRHNVRVSLKNIGTALQAS